MLSQLVKSTERLPKNTELKVITVKRKTTDLRRMSKSIEQATSYGRHSIYNNCAENRGDSRTEDGKSCLSARNRLLLACVEGDI